MIYVTADLHFGHERVIQYTKRPFQHAQEMDAALIQHWNSKVSASDEVYILGDVTMKSAAFAQEILKQLHGRKYLIIGNHDRFVRQASFDSSLFVWVKEYYELHYEGKCFILFHYPIEEWDGFFRGSIHLHGHQHNAMEVNIQNRSRGYRRYDVGVDANAMAPVSIQEILDFFACYRK